VFWVENLLSSCSLVKLWKSDENFQSIFGGCLKLKLRLQRRFKIRDFYLLGSYPLVGRHVVKHG